MDKSFSLLKVTPFRRLDKWYVEYYLNTKILESKYPMIKIGTLISPINRLETCAAWRTRDSRHYSQ